MVKKCTLVMLSMILIFTIIGLSSYSAGAEITTHTRDPTRQYCPNI